MITWTLRRLARTNDGSVLLETALTLMVLLILIFGIIDLGRALYTESNLISAAREGARYAAVDPTVANNDPNVRAVVEAHFSPFGGPALTDANVVVNDSVVAGLIVSVRVTVTYPFTWISPLPRLLGWGSGTTRNLHSQAEYRFEQ
jgi:Flp pilus assembly protein TadG